MQWVNMNPCDNSRCIMSPKQEYNMTVRFTTDKALTGGSLMVFLSQGDNHKDYKGFKPVDVCKNLLGGESCPLKSNHTVSLRFPLFLPTAPLKSLPDILTFTAMVTNHDDPSGKPLMCWQAAVDVNKKG